MTSEKPKSSPQSDPKNPQKSKKKTPKTPAAVSPNQSTRRLLLNLQPSDDPVPGENLAECTDREWEFAESAYPSELLNVKKKPNRVTVFAAPEKQGDPSKSIHQRATPKPSVAPAEEQETSALGRLLFGAARTVLDARKNGTAAEITVTLRFPKEPPRDLTPK